MKFVQRVERDHVQEHDRVREDSENSHVLPSRTKERKIIMWMWLLKEVGMNILGARSKLEKSRSTAGVESPTNDRREPVSAICGHSAQNTLLHPQTQGHSNPP